MDVMLTGTAMWNGSDRYDTDKGIFAWSDWPDCSSSLSVHVCEITVIDQPNAGGRAAGTLINMLLINPRVYEGDCKTSARDTHIYIYAHLSDTFRTFRQVF